jgi:hypothetical protein
MRILIMLGFHGRLHRKRIRALTDMLEYMGV